MKGLDRSGCCRIGLEVIAALSLLKAASFLFPQVMDASLAGDPFCKSVNGAEISAKWSIKNL
jgi:hypothetical protein